MCFKQTLLSEGINLHYQFYVYCRLTNSKGNDNQENKGEIEKIIFIPSKQRETEKVLKTNQFFTHFAICYVNLLNLFTHTRITAKKLSTLKTQGKTKVKTKNCNLRFFFLKTYFLDRDGG